MLNLNSNFLNGNVPWDTNYARKYLQIPQDQLEKINKIPGWSKTDISENIAAENNKASQNFEKSLLPQASTSTGNDPISNKNISEKDNLRNKNSDVQLKQDPVVSLTEKESFLENLSLSPLKKKHSPVNSLKRSSSLPNLCRNLIPAEVPSHSRSQEIFKNPANSTEKDILSFKLSPLSRRKILNKTYTFSHGDFNRDKLSDISEKSLTCLLENRNQLSKQKFKALDDSILDHKYLKETEIGKIKSDTVTLAPNQTSLKQGISLFKKKLLLLEKRLSPAKEMSAVPFTAKLINLENLSGGKNLKSSPSPVTANEVMTAVVSSDSVFSNLSDKLENSSSSKSCKSLEPQANSQILNEDCHPHKNASQFAKDKTGDALKTAVCNFDSFLSPPLPCGQLIKAGVPSLSQTVQSQKSAELETPRKLQSAEFSNKIVAPEKPISSFNVSQANSNEIVSESASVEVSGSKRKRKSRNEKSSKKLDAKKLKRTNIQFSSAQIKNMIEIMKIFHTEF